MTSCVPHSFIKPIQLGSLRLPVNVIQGPLAGYSCAPFRQLIWQWGGVGYCTSEMLSAYNIANQIPQPKRYTYKADSETRLCIQLSGHEVDHLAKAAHEVQQWGADLIDLNCGCPQPKIRKKKAGSQLLSTPDILYRLLLAMKSSVDCAVTAKIRVDGDSGEAFNREVMSAIESSGADGVIVHGRHWTERYDVPARWDEIADWVQSTSLPVIANGDVADVHSLNTVFDKTQCAGVMISRASLGRPWLFRALAQPDGEPSLYTPAPRVVADVLQQHVTGLIELDGEYRALLQARKLVGYYFPDMSFNASQEQQKNQLTTLHELEILLESLLTDRA